MAFGGVDGVDGVDGVCCGKKHCVSTGIAMVVVIILLLIALGIVF